MKKLLLYIFLLTSSIGYSQFIGSGTYADPYSGGTLTTNQTWLVASSPIYVSGDLTIGDASNEGHLTIEPGVTVRFCATTADIIITGLGRITADGSISNKIRFTADTDKDGNYGELGETWGHFSFQSMGSAGASLFDYCIFEYGDVRTAGSSDNPYRYGGAIHAAFSNLTISNCALQNNKAKWGGAIFIGKNSSPSISNCYIYNNESLRAGGGVYCFDGSAAIIQNCIFEANDCLEPSSNSNSGGGLCAKSNCSIKLLNSTFVNNTTSRPAGASIELYGTTNSNIVLNTICWGSGTHFYIYGTTHVIQHCAVQGTVPAGTGNFQLNSINSASDGPNFIATDGSDWSIKLLSPCRDAGLNSYTGVTIPPADYENNPQIGKKDIGTYEVQYSRWTGTTSSSWTTVTNWEDDVDPSSGTGDVIIPTGCSNYPNETTVTIGANNYLIIDPKAQATFGTLNNSSTGTLWLKSDSFEINDSIPSLMVDTYEKNSGTEIIELSLQGNNSMWHYISPPVSSLSATTFSSSSAAVAEYRENLIEDNMNNGWVTSTGYHYDVSLATPSWVYEGWTWNNLLAGQGYNYYSATSKKFNISGNINTSDILIDLVYNSGGFTENPVEHGFNLIGNPYTCTLDWDLVVEDVANEYVWDDAEATIYFRKNGISYYYNYGIGEIYPDDYNTYGNLIPPMQGFFIKTNADVELTIPTDARAHSESMRYKGNPSISKINLKIENSENSDQSLIWFSEKATPYFDNLFDSRKIFISENSPSIYSYFEETNYAINGIPFPESSLSVPLTINATSEGLFTIKATEIQNLDNYLIYLKDQVQNITVNLSQTNSYSFYSPAGLSADRFLLEVSNVQTSIPENSINNKPFNIYFFGNQLNIQTLSDDWSGIHGKISIIDFTGKVVLIREDNEFYKDEISILPLNNINGLYLVEIRSGLKRYVCKVLFNK